MAKPTTPTTPAAAEHLDRELNQARLLVAQIEAVANAIPFVLEEAGNLPGNPWFAGGAGVPGAASQALLDHLDWADSLAGAIANLARCAQARIGDLPPPLLRPAL